MALSKQALCEAFCEELEVRDVPVGLAVRTPFALPSGDSIGFYIVRDPSDLDMWRFEDSGLLVPMLEASGVSLESGPRAEAFKRLLDECGAEYDEESRELHSPYMSDAEIPAEATRFVSLLLRMQDFELLHADTVANTFRFDVEQAIKKRFGNVMKVEFRAKLSDAWDNYLADAVIKPQSGDPLVLFFGTSEAKVDEAVIMHYDLRAKGQKSPVALVLETAKPANVSGRALRRAHNRLEAIPVFRGDEDAAMDKIASQISAQQP